MTETIRSFLSGKDLTPTTNICLSIGFATGGKLIVYNVPAELSLERYEKWVDMAVEHAEELAESQVDDVTTTADYFIPVDAALPSSSTFCTSKEFYQSWKSRTSFPKLCLCDFKEDGSSTESCDGSCDWSLITGDRQ